MKPLSIDGLCDWVERAKPTPTQLQRRRVYLINHEYCFNVAFDIKFEMHFLDVNAVYFQ